MTADVIQLKEWVVCPNCKWFKCGMGGTAYDPSMDRCDHPDNLEKKEQFNYRSGPYTRTHNKKHPAALNSNGKCKMFEANNITEED